MSSLLRAIGVLAAKLVLTAGLAACAAAPPALSTPAAQTTQIQHLVARSTGDWPTPQAFAARVEQVAGVPVRDAGVIATRLYAFTLVCVDAPACQAAMHRLAAARDLVADLQTNERRTLMPAPRPPLAQ